MTEGLRLTFTDTPHLSLFPPPWAHPKKKDLPGLHSLLPSFLERGVIREIFSPVPLFFSRVFIVPKKDGPLRMVIDLHILNRLLVVPHFLMESVLKIAEGIIERLWGCTIDLKDAYFHVPMAWFFHQFLAFAVEGRTYVFQYLPFGLSLAPWAFHRVIKPVMAQLHREFIRIHSYLDDFLNLHPLREGLLQSRESVARLHISRYLGECQEVCHDTFADPGLPGCSYGFAKSDFTGSSSDYSEISFHVHKMFMHKSH